MFQILNCCFDLSHHETENESHLLMLPERFEQGFVGSVCDLLHLVVTEFDQAQAVLQIRWHDGPFLLQLFELADNPWRVQDCSGRERNRIDRHSDDSVCVVNKAHAGTRRDNELVDGLGSQI